MKGGLAACDARFVLYAELLYNACQVYSDYLAETQTVDRLRGVNKEIDDFAPASA